LEVFEFVAEIDCEGRVTMSNVVRIDDERIQESWFQEQFLEAQEPRCRSAFHLHSKIYETTVL
jgi:hypothetical protein